MHTASVTEHGTGTGMPHRVRPTITTADGTPLAATVHLPPGDGRVAALVEATSRRIDDVGADGDRVASRLATEFGMAVVRVDRRGTGASGGRRAPRLGLEVTDVGDVVRWVAAQSWSTGAVGVFGHGEDGELALAAATDASVGLGAVVAIGATDDLATNGRHHLGGVPAMLDLAGEPLAELARDGLPPGPDRRHDWLDAWAERTSELAPRLLDRLRHGAFDRHWRDGPLRSGPDGAGLERLVAPIMLIGGWRGSASDNTIRTIERVRVPWRIVVGDGGDTADGIGAAAAAIGVDVVAELAAFVDQHLRGGPPSAARRGQLFVRGPAATGGWRDIDVWPVVGCTTAVRRVPAPRPAVDELVVRGDTGSTGIDPSSWDHRWAAATPPDHRVDDASSLAFDWVHPRAQLLVGAPAVSMRVRSSEVVGQVAVTLSDIAPDGRSTPITSGVLDLACAGRWPADPGGAPDEPARVVAAGEWLDVRVHLATTTWTFVPGHRVRLSIAGADWPRWWPAAAPFVLGVDRGSIRVDLPVVDDLPPSRHHFAPAPGGSGHTDATWRRTYDVVARQTRIELGTSSRAAGGIAERPAVADELTAELGVDVADPGRAWSTARRTFEVDLPDGSGVTRCRSSAELQVRGDRNAFDVELVLRVERDGRPVATRRWHELVDRHPS
ncbi:MAG: CocE/NonD family hydrolase [Acidimicrobiales bacterium]|nr:CocE/NonD family hydrolase [Acidimicrobiales bacterium]MCB9393020.1 CocE/NonD family hydrolase [Acidimicrobiaceae bacterium]